MMPKPKNDLTPAEILGRLNGTKETPIKPLNSNFTPSVPLMEQLEEWLKKNYHFRRNEITRYIELEGKECDTTDFNSIYVQAKKKVSNKVNYQDVERLINSNFTESYNPIHGFFEKYKTRKPDGVIKKLSSCIISDCGFTDANFYPAYVEEFIKRWLVGIVSSCYGRYSPLLLVLSGGQNTGKTEFFRRLLPPELKRFYAESRLDAGKDDEILMCQKLLIMDDEFGGKSKRAAERLKELTSKQVFTLREPYGRKNVDLRRLAVLCGTSNDTQILSDPTGNRRIIPIQVKEILFDVYNSVDKTDLFIEAYHLYKDGYNWELTKEDIEKLNENSREFESISAESELIFEYFQLPVSGDPAVQRRKPSWLIAWLYKQTATRLDIRKFLIAMDRAGFEYKPCKVAGKTERVITFMFKQQPTEPDEDIKTTI